MIYRAVHLRPKAGVLVLAVASVLAGACDGRRAAEAEAAYRASLAALRARDYASAVDYARQAIERAPDRTDAWLQLGIAHSRLSQWTDAIRAYQRVIELDPSEERAANNLANVYFRQGRYEEAAIWYDKALEIDPDYLLATFHYGWVLRQLNRLDEAERAFTHCRRIRPANEQERSTQVDCHYYLGTLRFRRGDYATAASVMEEIVAARPGHSEARHFLGLSYRQLGRLDQAAEQLDIHRRLLRAGRTDPIPEPED